MGRNSKSSKSNSNSVSLCQKLLKLLAGYPIPSFMKFRPRQEESRPANPTQPPIRNGIMVQQNAPPPPVPLPPSHSLQTHAHQDNVATKIEKKQVEKEGKTSGEDINDVFNGYISQVKHRLGSISSKRYDSVKKGEENVKDDQRFSDYIIRAKNKLRATSSSVGWSKGSSIKTE